MQTYKAWTPGLVQDRRPFVKVRADHSDHEQVTRAENLPAIDSGIQDRAKAKIVRLRERLARVEKVLSRDLPKDRRKRLVRFRRDCKRDLTAVLELASDSDQWSDAETLPRYIERHGHGYRVAMSQRHAGRVYSARSETHTTIRAASAAIGRVRLHLADLIAKARESGQGERETA